MGFNPALEPMSEETVKPRVILCSNVLPVILERDASSGRWTAVLDRDSLFEDGPMYVSLREVDFEVLHVGVPQAFIPDEEREEVESLLHKFNCYPVWCDAKRAHNYFQGYCKGILWPTFHNIIDLYSRLEPKTILKSRHTTEGADVLPFNAQEKKTADNKNGERSWKPARSWSPMEAETCWPDYCAMNGLFARKVVEIYSMGDILWVHDYHLLLLPSYLLRKLTNAKIALFLHVPFPSSEIFRTLATREEILRAMLCADHIGFDLYEYARHFLTCCSRMLGLPYQAKRGGYITVNNGGREVAITCSHVGVDTHLIQERLATPQVQSLAQSIALGLLSNDQQAAGSLHSPSYVASNKELAEMFGDNSSSTKDQNGTSSSSLSTPLPLRRFDSGSRAASIAAVPRRQLIVAIDEIEGLRGLGLKLLALDRLFTDYPHLRDRVLLRQIGLKLDCRPDDYKSCHDEVVGLVKLMREKWGPVVEYEECTQISLAERLALFQNADVYLSTAIRIGVDMLPFEFLLARRNPAGCVILSEFSACSRVLHGSLRVNPFKTSALAATIEEALSMSIPERTARSARDLEFIERNHLLDWAHRILNDIMVAHKDISEPLTKYGGGFGTRLVGYGKQIHKQQELDSIMFSEAFKNAKRRLLLIDYSGTLVETTSMNMYMKSGGTARAWHYEKGGSRRPGGCLETRDPINDTARTALIDLCRDSANIVVVISSDLRAELDHALKGIPNLALIAENGFVYRINPESPWRLAVDTEHDAGGDWYGGNSSEGFYGGGAESADGESVGDSSEGASLPDQSAEDHQEMQNWQELVSRIMKGYSGRTNGSFVWQSPSAVSFNYVLSDPELGALQASNLALELEQMLAVMPLTVEQGKGFVTVRLRGVNRGTAVRELLGYLNHRCPDSNPVDFIACFGDDTEDESSFHATNKYTLGSSYKKATSPVQTFSVRVGPSAKSKAKFSLPHPDDLVELLQELVKTGSSGKFRRNFSTGEFRTQEANILGNFKTKQSYITLSQADTGIEPTVSPTAAASTLSASPSVQGMRHSPSYVASSKELAEMFSGKPASPSEAPSHDTSDMFPDQPPDLRAIPPTEPGDDVAGGLPTQDDTEPKRKLSTVTSSDDDDDYEEDREYLNYHPIPVSTGASAPEPADETPRSKRFASPRSTPETPKDEDSPSFIDSELVRLAIAGLTGAALTLAFVRRSGPPKP